MSRDKVSPGDPVYCAHGVYRDQPCGRCLQEDHDHPTLDDALACAECQQGAQAALRALKRSEAPPEAPESLSRRAGELERWWLAMANEEIERTVPKVIEYGSTDLAEIGRQMASVSGLATPEGLTDEAYWSELGITFYACGKMARVMEAVREGRVASDDSWFDLGVYVRMVQRVRHSGAWPGVSIMRTG